MSTRLLPWTRTLFAIVGVQWARFALSRPLHVLRRSWEEFHYCCAIVHTHHALGYRFRAKGENVALASILRVCGTFCVDIVS